MKSWISIIILSFVCVSTYANIELKEVQDVYVKLDKIKGEIARDEKGVPLQLKYEPSKNDSFAVVKVVVDKNKIYSVAVADFTPQKASRRGELIFYGKVTDKENLKFIAYRSEKGIDVPMADGMYENGRIYFVIAVITLIVVVIFLVVFGMNRKLNKLEKEVKE